jgi:pimeloyl-ACP methyl ester carboxylesterase
MNCTAQTMLLRDGRTLGFAEWGDLNGKPVFFFGGSNSARCFRHPDDSIIREMDIHLYTFDRPGQGLSTRQPQRRLLDWPEDIRDFATQKSISRFAVVAASQGGPYGAACAYALPELVSSVSLVSGVAGLEDSAVTATQNRMIRTQIFIARRVPWLLALQGNLMRPLLKGERAKKLVGSLLSNLPDIDKQAMSAPRAIDLMIEDIREGMRQGGAGGVDDMRAVVTDWGFRLEDIRTKAFIWQGADDPNVTPAMARFMAERIPNNETVFVPGAGHLLIISHWRKILEQLVDCWAA